MAITLLFLYPISYFIILYHIISYYIILNHIKSYYIILYHIISYSATIMAIWRFPKKGLSPVIIHFRLGFSMVHKPSSWGSPIEAAPAHRLSGGLIRQHGTRRAVAAHGAWPTSCPRRPSGGASQKKGKWRQWRMLDILVVFSCDI